MKKRILFVITILTAVILSGCTKVTPESLMNQFKDNKENISYTQTIDMEFSMSLAGESMNMEVSVDSDVKTKGDISKLDMTMKALGMKQSMEAYIDSKEEVMYSKTDEWVKESLPVTYNNDMFDAFDISKDVIEVNHKGKEGYLVKGTIDMESVGEIFESLDIDMEGKIEADYLFDKKTKKPIRIDADFTDILEEYVEEYSNDIGEDIDISIETCIISITNIELGNTEDITIPEEALKARESRDDESLLNILGDETGIGEVDAEEAEYIEVEPLHEIEAEEELLDEHEGHDHEDIELNVIDPGFKFFQFNRTSLKIGANKLSDLMNAGLTMDNDNELEPGEKDTIEIYEYDMLFEVTNVDSEKRGIKDCVITGLVTYSDILEINGLKVGMDKNEALNLLGKPAEEEEDDEKTISHWMDEDGFYINTISENGKVIGITVMIL